MENYFLKWNSIYKLEYTHYFEQRIIQKYILNKKKNCLVIGSAAGRELNFLKDKFEHILCIDIDKKQIDDGKKKWKSCVNIKWKLADYDFYNTINTKYDLIVCLGLTINYLKNLESFFDTSKKILNDDGKIFISCGNLEHFSFKNKISKKRILYTDKQLMFFFKKKKFDLLEKKGQRLIIDHSIFHSIKIPFFIEIFFSLIFPISYFRIMTYIIQNELRYSFKKIN